MPSPQPTRPFVRRLALALLLGALALGALAGCGGDGEGDGGGGGNEARREMPRVLLTIDARCADWNAAPRSHRAAFSGGAAERLLERGPELVDPFDPARFPTRDELLAILDAGCSVDPERAVGDVMLELVLSLARGSSGGG